MTQQNYLSKIFISLCLILAPSVLSTGNVKICKIPISTSSVYYEKQLFYQFKIKIKDKKNISEIYITAYSNKSQMVLKDKINKFVLKGGGVVFHWNGLLNGERITDLRYPKLKELFFNLTIIYFNGKIITTQFFSLPFIIRGEG